VWDLRPLGTKESGYVLTPRQGTAHRVRRVMSGLVYRRNPLAKAISHFQLWKKKRKANKKKKEAEAFSTTRAVGVAADDYSTLKASGGRKLKSHKSHRHHPGPSQDGAVAVTESESDDEHQHHNPKHLPKRVKHYVKEHHQKHVEEPRDTAITTVVRDMHNRFRARFFPPLKVSVYDWVAVDQQEFLGRVEIDPAVVYLLEREVAEGRKRASMSGVTTEGLAKANAADVARENARLSNRGRRGSFLREMIDTDMESDEDEEQEQEQEPDDDNVDFGDDVIAERKAKEVRENYDNPAKEDDKVTKNEDEEEEQARQEDINEKQEDKEEERNREVRDVDEEEAQRRNEKERLQERADIRRAAGSPEELERFNSTDSSQDHHSEHEDHQPQREQKHEQTQTKREQHQEQQQQQHPEQTQKSKPLDANTNTDVVEGKEARRREKQEIERERKERKDTEKREREQKKKDEQDRRRLEQERKKRARRMSKAGLQVEGATVEKGVEEEQRGITVVLPLYAGEEERNTPGLERHHAGLSGHISITLTVSPPHWAADCATLSDQPLPV
jgi:hypothetical protein